MDHIDIANFAPYHDIALFIGRPRIGAEGTDRVTPSPSPIAAQAIDIASTMSS